jgi:hypothetical protein
MRVKNDLSNFVFDLQRFGPDDDDKGGDIDPKVLELAKMFSGEVVEKEDPITKKSIKIPKELDAVIGHFISTTRAATEGQYKPLLEKLEGESAELTDVKAELEKLREVNMTAEEKARADAKKVIVKHEAAVKTAEEKAAFYKNLFESEKVSNEIYGSFGDKKLCNPKQTALIFEKEGEAHLEEIIDAEGKPTNTFETRMSLMIENEDGEPIKCEGTPGELFKKWVEQEKNLHHLQNDLPPGGGSRSSGKGKGKVDLSKLSPVERMNAAREV